jgi:hypothetical protein
MRRPVRAVTRLLVVLLVTLLAVPGVAARPAPDGTSPSPSAAAPKGTTERLERRGRVVASELKPLDESAKPPRTVPRLPWTQQAAGGPTVSTQAPAGIAAAPVEATPTGRPPIVTPTYAGMDIDTSFGPVEPPDPWIAVGPNHVVQVVNLGLRISSRQNGSAERFALADFFQLPNTAFLWADPRVIYDSTHNRWIAIQFSADCTPGGGAIYGHGYIDFAISDTADPRGAWTIYWLTYDDAFPDYPGIGTSTDKIGMSVNVFRMANSSCVAGTFLSADLNVLDWADLKAGGEVFYWNFPLGPSYSTIRPALGVPSPSPDLHAIVGVDTGAEYNVGYFRVGGSVANETVTMSDIEDLTAAGVADAFGVPPQPRQPGSPPTIVNAVDGRPTDAITQNGYLYFVSTTGCTPNGDTEERACVRVTEVFANGGPSPEQDFLLAEAGHDLYMGGIGLSQKGALHVTYTRSSPAVHAETRAVYQLPADPANAVSNDELVKDGTVTYNGTRWGDYVGVAQDPQDPNLVWQTNEVAKSGGGWQTHWSPLSTAVGGTYFPIEPHRVLDTRPAYAIGGYNTKFFVNQARSIVVGGTGPIPEDAVAVTGNLTVVGQTGAGHFSLSPVLGNPPTSSIINFPVGDVRANNVTMPIGDGGFIHAWYVAPAGSRSDLVFDVTGYFKADDTGATYEPLTPARILDTRTGNGLPGRFQRDVARSFQVSGRGGVPAGAVAVTGNLTVTGQTGSGHISLTPTPNNNPPTSTLNFPVGDNRANGVTIPLSLSGSMSAVYKSSTSAATTNLIFDVMGYYLPGTGGLRFYPLNPGRRMDTRTTVLTGLTGKFNANTSRVLDTAGFMGVPTSAEAITGNLTVTQPNKAGHLALTPDVIPNPPTSTLNFPASDTRANGVTQPLNSSGDIAIYFKAAAGGTVHAILDVSGYFR